MSKKFWKVLKGRWKLIFLFYLFRDGTLSLSELEPAIPGIAQKMLIQQLRSVEYSLTPSRQALCPVLDELALLGAAMERPTLRAAHRSQWAEGIAPSFCHRDCCLAGTAAR